MMRSSRNCGRHGHAGCFCCNPRPTAKVLRKRERRAWMREV